MEGSKRDPFIDGEVQAGKSRVRGRMHGPLPIACGIQPKSSIGVARVIVIPWIDQRTDTCEDEGPNLSSAWNGDKDELAYRRNFIPKGNEK